MNNYIKQIKTIFEQNIDKERVYFAEKYMRFQFKSFGLTTSIRRDLSKKYIKNHGLPKDDEFIETIKQLWADEYRDMQYFAMFLLEKYINKADKNFIEFIEYLIENKSWWDSIDFLAPTLVRKHFDRFPDLIPIYTEKWINSENFWFQRSAILFQLNKKQDTDIELLFKLILKRKDSKEFFVQKAMGWSLRQYAKIEPVVVLDFVNKNTDLPTLTKREAVKNIKL